METTNFYTDVNNYMFRYYDYTVTDDIYEYEYTLSTDEHTKICNIMALYYIIKSKDDKYKKFIIDHDFEKKIYLLDKNDNKCYLKNKKFDCINLDVKKNDMYAKIYDEVKIELEGGYNAYKLGEKYRILKENETLLSDAVYDNKIKKLKYDGHGVNIYSISPRININVLIIQQYKIVLGDKIYINRHTNKLELFGKEHDLLYGFGNIFKYTNKDIPTNILAWTSIIYNSFIIEKNNSYHIILLNLPDMPDEIKNIYTKSMQTISMKYIDINLENPNNPIFKAFPYEDFTETDAMMDYIKCALHSLNTKCMPYVANKLKNKEIKSNQKQNIDSSYKERNILKPYFDLLFNGVPLISDEMLPKYYFYENNKTKIINRFRQHIMQIKIKNEDFINTDIKLENIVNALNRHHKKIIIDGLEYSLTTIKDADDIAKYFIEEL